MTISSTSCLMIPALCLNFADSGVGSARISSVSNTVTISSPSTSGSSLTSWGFVSWWSLLRVPCVDVWTIVHPCFTAPPCSVWDGYEPGLGACRCVYDDASVEVELFCLGLGTGLGAVDADARWAHAALLDDSSSDPLSQASSSPQSEIE